MVTVSKEEYFDEILDIKNKLEDFIELINSGKTTYFKDLALKLRLLYIFKSGTKSLIKTISELYNINIRVFIQLTLHEKIEKGLLPSSLGESLIFEQINSVVSWFESGNEFVDVLDAINKNEVLIEGKRYSYKELIEYAADKMGGAHLDKKQDPKHLNMHSNDLLLGGLPIAQRAIYDTARASIELILLIEKYICNGQSSKFVSPITN